MNKVYFIALFMIVSIHDISSQSQYRKGYVVKNSGDTITGFIGYREGDRNYKVCDYRKTKDQKSVEFLPNEILSYGIDDDAQFITNEILLNDTKEKVFFEVLVKGKISLYKYFYRFFVTKNDNEFHELENKKTEVSVDGKNYVKKSKRYVGTLSYMMTDCNGVRNDIEKALVRERELTELVEKYNDCTNQTSVSFKSKRPWFEFHFGGTLGFNASRLELQSGYLPESEFDPAYSIMPGINFDFLSPRINERMSFHTGLFYLATNYTSYSEIIYYENFVNRNDLTIDSKQLKLPIGIRYTFPVKKYTPYLNIGISYTFNLESSVIWVLERERNGVVETIESESSSNANNSHIGYWGGIGIKRPVSSKLMGFLEIRFEKTNGLSEFDPSSFGVFHEDNKNIQLLIGISY